MENEYSLTSTKFYGSKLNILGQTTTEKINKLFNTNEETIDNNYNDSHYFCAKCHMFPFIKFNKDRKSVRMTCSCFNNKNILLRLINNYINKFLLFILLKHKINNLFNIDE
jgi:hypothetical protein